jgi:hypothetical protein
MNILMFGDSWGVRDTWGNPSILENSSSFWPEFKLFKYGHYTFNISKSNNTNIKALEEVIEYLQNTDGNLKIDCFIWYYTALMRDYNTVSELNINDYQVLLNEISYKVQELSTSIHNKYPNIKWIIIGGEAPIHNVSHYNWASYIIEDWKSDLLNIKLPYYQGLGSLGIIHELRKQMGTELLIQEMDKLKFIQNALKKSTPKLFSDGRHPNAKVSGSIVERLKEQKLI